MSWSERSERWWHDWSRYVLEAMPANPQEQQQQSQQQQQQPSQTLTARLMQMALLEDHLEMRRQANLSVAFNQEKNTLTPQQKELVSALLREAGQDLAAVSRRRFRLRPWSGLDDFVDTFDCILDRRQAQERLREMQRQSLHMTWGVAVRVLKTAMGMAREKREQIRRIVARVSAIGPRLTMPVLRRRMRRMAMYAASFYTVTKLTGIMAMMIVAAMDAKPHLYTVVTPRHDTPKGRLFV